ncbi:protein MICRORCHIDIA 6 isoform X6 [Ziziphus jujuba]|uniref:Protein MICRORCHIDIA 6 isoform X6 n=1 Tax=Ziziphus jujuba TaxID=326968 RepID=A0ABM4A0X1_ZIZJJ|nr:protein MICRORCHIDIA 6 isoform X6 [Ziziphus jujuba]
MQNEQYPSHMKKKKKVAVEIGLGKRHLGRQIRLRLCLGGKSEPEIEPEQQVSGDELVEFDVKPAKLKSNLVGSIMQQEENNKARLSTSQTSTTKCGRQEFDENRSPNAWSTGHSSSSMLDQAHSPVDDIGLSSSSPICQAPICRQFWKAGNYDGGLSSKVTLQNGKNCLHVHPMFLHSNATSHKWAFGAVAELLDNAVDEIQNGATFVAVDKILNPRDESPALLIQDDGDGMDPEAMRRCMSFGFSDKNSNSAIGQYGNGFKTGTMRLGADVIVFSRHLDERILTQSIGLLSYSFLTRTGYNRIVVPMVDYKYNTSTGSLEILQGREHYMSNLSLLLKWSPYSTEAELLKQFDDIGSHGTKVIIYNLWFNDDGHAELDFDSDPEDICISGDTKKFDTCPAWIPINEQHIGNRFQYSLRVYLSILYLQIPESFNIILRGKVVEHHSIANDLIFPECILYKPLTGEGQVITTIGFDKEAPLVQIHGFNVYHKNRLIRPFWQVLRYTQSKGRGIIGVLEANFIKPTHNKQDFEATSLFRKLEVRLKEMVGEYWDYHCGLVGYQQYKKPKAPTKAQVSSGEQPIIAQASSGEQPIIAQASSGEQLFPFNDASTAVCASKVALERPEQSNPNSQSRYGQGQQLKRKAHGDFVEVEMVKRQGVKEVNVADPGQNQGIQLMNTSGQQLEDQETMPLIQENKKLRAKCLEYEKEEEELLLKVSQLNSEIKEVENEYSRLLAEFQSLEPAKEEKAWCDQQFVNHQQDFTADRFLNIHRDFIAR